MTYEQALQTFGLPASPVYREQIRRLLVEETERARRSDYSEEMLRTLCIQLFSLGVAEDALLIWDAKRSNFDAGCGLDIQFLCGAGLQATKDFLAASSAPTAAKALSYLTDCEKTGDFVGFSPAAWVARYCEYFRLDSTPNEPNNRNA
jgi:hypothetical protein